MSHLPDSRIPRNKSDFYKLFERGVFGNRSLTWPTLADWQQSGYQGTIAIRTKGVGTRCDYHIRPEDVVARYEDFLAQGYAPEQCHFSQMAVDSTIVAQGEVLRSYRGLELTYSREQVPMRQALAKSTETAVGLQADLLLRRFCCERGYAWITELLEEWPTEVNQCSPVIEWSAYSVPLGTLGWRTVIWELRGY